MSNNTQNRSEDQSLLVNTYFPKLLIAVKNLAKSHIFQTNKIKYLYLQPRHYELEYDSFCSISTLRKLMHLKPPYIFLSGTLQVIKMRNGEQLFNLFKKLFYFKYRKCKYFGTTTAYMFTHNLCFKNNDTKERFGVHVHLFNFTHNCTFSMANTFIKFQLKN